MCKKLICTFSFVLMLGLILTSTADAELVGWWKLDDGSGTVAVDSSGNGYDGTITNATWDTGKFGMALAFDGTAYVDLPAESWSTIEMQATFAFWAYGDPASQPQANFIFGDFQDPANNESRVMSAHVPWSNSNVYFDTGGTTAGGYDRINQAAALEDFAGSWSHWTFVKNAETGDQQVYLNGELWHSGAGMVRPMTGVTAFTIGTKPSLAEGWYNGMMDDVRLFDHALSVDEIQAVLAGGGADFPYALGPDPADGAMLEATWVNLKWRAGDSAVSHDVYIGESFEDVDTGAEGTFVGNQTDTGLIVGFFGFPLPDGLTPGTTYYWRIDEVNPDDPNSPWKGDIWSFWVPPRKAYNASPADGVGVVRTDATLSWTIGFNGKLGQVYFGTDAAEVDAGTGGTAKGPVVGTTYDPGPLEEGTTYYWRVDQFDGTETHKGDVWSLTTVPVVAVTDPDLLGWWTMDEGAGTTVVDWSGHGGHGSVVSDPTWADGYQGTALEFTSNGQYVDCGDEAGAGVTADFTLAAWVKMLPGNAGQYLGIAGKLENVGGYHGFGLVRHNATNLFRLWVSDGDTAGINGIASSDTIYTDTEWHHVAGVREGQLNGLYVDGVKQAPGNSTDFVPSPDFFHIGRQYSHLNDRYWKGRIDDVRVYDKALTDAQIADVMLGDKTLAGSPSPGSDAVVDIRDISSLSFSAGTGATSHDVYLGTDRDAVAGADNSAPEFQGNQAGTSLSLAGLVELGGGDYYWRIDEVAADGTVTGGTIWKFTVPAYLIVDNFESYNNIDPPAEGSNRIFDNWIDGFGTTTNGALVGNDLPPYAEQSVVQSGGQSMIYAYDNAGKTSEATLTLTRGDWTAEGVTKLSVWMEEADSSNAADRVYVALNGTAVIYHDDPAATQLGGWNEWIIDLSAFGIDLTNVSSISIGIGTKNAPAADGGTGTLYFDEIGLIP